MLNLLKQFALAAYGLRRRINSEETYLRCTLQRFVSPGKRLVDVGCGFCRFYDIVQGCGLEYVGVDVNAETVRANRALGIPAYEPHEFHKEEQQVDVLLLAHIIEHFPHRELVPFLNGYLDRLRVGGFLVVFTPLSHRGFHDDFDHVKLYNPAALRQAFVQQEGTQTQDFGLHGRYEEVGLWFKRDSLWHSHADRRWMHVYKIPLSLLTSLTGARIGRLTGYGMVLRKLGV